MTSININDLTDQNNQMWILKRRQLYNEISADFDIIDKQNT